jgi:hypothetical protein
MRGDWKDQAKRVGGKGWCSRGAAFTSISFSVLLFRESITCRPRLCKDGSTVGSLEGARINDTHSPVMATRMLVGQEYRYSSLMFPILPKLPQPDRGSKDVPSPARIQYFCLRTSSFCLITSPACSTAFLTATETTPWMMLWAKGIMPKRAELGFYTVIFRSVDGGTDAAVEEVHNGDVADNFPGFLFAQVGLLVAYWIAACD